MDFYGIKAPPPSQKIAQAFGSFAEPVLLKGGQGTTYRAGEIVLKPAEGVEDHWIFEVFSTLPEAQEVRFARPIKSIHGSWVHEGYVAWSFLEGECRKQCYAQKIAASRKFHDLLKHIPKPAQVGHPSNSWSTANLVVWQQHPFDYAPEFMQLIDQIIPHLREIPVSHQLIHGDLSGNFLLQEGLPPAIIDFSPTWAPGGFAEGILLADAIAWEKASAVELEAFRDIPNIDQLAWRGTFRRIAEQAEHTKWFGKDKNQAAKEARVFQKAIDYLKEHC